MNFEDITNVSDLVKQNEKPNPKEAIHALITEAVKNEGPAVALQIATEVVAKIADLHQSVSEEKAEEGDCDSAVLWAQDQRTLQIAKVMLETIEL